MNAARAGTHRTVIARLVLLAGLIVALLLAFGGPASRLGQTRKIATVGGQGYWLLARDGGVFSYGDAQFFGTNLNSGADIIAIAPTPTLKGYWTADDDGSVFAYGDAGHYGARVSTVDDIRGFAVRPQGNGYWLVTADGVVTARGAAAHLGNSPALGGSQKIVGMASTASGNGYWLVGRDGGIFAFGDASFHGSTGAITLNKPIVGMARTPSGNGYWLVASDGGVFAFGNAAHHGTTASNPPASGISGLAPTASGNGYWLVARNGKVFPFGDAVSHGDPSSVALAQPVVAIAATPVVNVNAVPTATGDSASLAEDGSATINVLANDSGLLDGTISVAITSGPAHGSASVGSDKRISYTPTGNYNGSDSITYKVTDGDGEFSTAVLSLTVSAVNDAPVASSGTLSTDEDMAAGATLSASDLDGNGLTFSVVAGPAHGSVSISGSNYAYTPHANYHGSDSFTFRANDGSVNSNTATVSVTVDPVNDAPVADSAELDLNEDIALAGEPSGSDVDGDELTFDILTPPGDGDLTENLDGSYTYTPDANFVGTVSLTYKANDGELDSEIATVTINVLAVDDPAVPADGTLETDEDEAVNGLLTSTDAIDGGDPDYVIVSGPDHGDISGLDPVTGDYTYTPDANYHGLDSFTFAATGDGEDVSEPATLDITVDSIEDEPVFGPGSEDLETDEDTPLELAFPATDGDGDTLTYAIDDAVHHPELSIDSGTGDVTFTPALNSNGDYSFTVSVTDGSDPVTKDVTITVTAVNDAPTFDLTSEASGTGLEENEITGDVDASDVEGDDLVFGIGEGDGPASGTASVDSETGEWSYEGDLNFAGEDSFIITVSDGNGNETVLEIELTVTNVNDAPTVSTIGAQSMNEDVPLEIPFTVGDPDIDDELEIIVASSDGIMLPEGALALSGDGEERTLTVSPQLHANGTVLIFVAVTDGEIPVLQSFVLTIDPVNDVPEADDDTDATTAEDTALVGSLTGSDPVEGSDVDFSLDGENGGAEHGTVALDAETGAYTYSPDENYNGPDSFSFVANDGDDDSEPATVSIDVTPVNDAPVTNAGELTTAEDTDGSGTLTGEDTVEGSSVTFALSGANGGATHGTVTITDSDTGAYTYEPNADFNGPDSFSFVVNDGDDDSAPATVSITVTPVNDAPVVSAIGSQSVNEDEILEIDFSATDVDGDTLTLLVGSSNLTLLPPGSADPERRRGQPHPDRRLAAQPVRHGRPVHVGLRRPGPLDPPLHPGDGSLRQRPAGGQRRQRARPTRTPCCPAS